MQHHASLTVIVQGEINILTQENAHNMLSSDKSGLKKSVFTNACILSKIKINIHRKNIWKDVPPKH